MKLTAYQTVVHILVDDPIRYDENEIKKKQQETDGHSSFVKITKKMRSNISRPICYS